MSLSQLDPIKIGALLKQCTSLKLQDLAWSIEVIKAIITRVMQVAAALAARHIGGAVNYVGVAETLGISGSAQAAGLAADNLLCAAYFATIFHLARHIPADDTLVSAGNIRLRRRAWLKRKTM